MDDPRKDSTDCLHELMRSGLLESPSGDFTRRVMSGVRHAGSAPVFRYKPAIGKNGWWLVGLISAVFLGGVVFLSDPPKESMWRMLPYTPWLEWISMTFQRLMTSQASLIMMAVMLTSMLLLVSEKFFTGWRHA